MLLARHVVGIYRADRLNRSVPSACFGCCLGVVWRIFASRVGDDVPCVLVFVIVFSSSG
jgi:hypothetical protein